MYNLYKLEHAELVQSANKILEKALKDIQYEVETNVVDAVVYTIYANGLQRWMTAIAELSIPNASYKVAINVHFEKYVEIKFSGANEGNDIWVRVLKNGEQNLEFFIK